MKRLSTLALLLVGLTGCNIAQSDQLPVSVGDYFSTDICVSRNSCSGNVCRYVQHVHDISGSWVLTSVVAVQFGTNPQPYWSHLPSIGDFWVLDSAPTCSAPPTNNDPE